MKKDTNKTLIVGLAAMVILGLAFIFIVKKQTDPRPLKIPFSSLGWTSTLEDMEKADGKVYVTFASSGGTTYQYIKEYLGVSGYLKYHFNDQGILVGIAWSCEAADKKELNSLYEKISSDLTAAYGEGKTTSSGLNHAWELSDGTSVRLNTGFGGSDTSLQYFYINPIAL
ncbi:MAG: hypothetical protein IJU93_02675 [Lachnospiraceae bacterium]|nr:hypothetical protein [Lachnospiraceae bacterium]